MSRKYNFLKKLLLFVALGFCLTVVVGGLIAWNFVRTLQANIDRMQRPLIYQTNFQPILAECDVLMQQAYISQRKQLKFNTIPPNLPAILALKPSVVVATPNDVTLMFGGGFHHWFLRAYSPGTSESGTKKLIDRLWFEDEAGRVPDP